MPGGVMELKFVGEEKKSHASCRDIGSTIFDSNRKTPECLEKIIMQQLLFTA